MNNVAGTSILSPPFVERYEVRPVLKHKDQDRGRSGVSETQKSLRATRFQRLLATQT